MPIKRSKTRALVIAIVVLFLVVSTIYLVMTRASGQRGIAGSPAIRSASNGSNGSVFPWERGQSEELSKNGSRVGNSEAQAIANEELNVAGWMTGMQKPKIPVHEIVAKYRGSSLHNDSQKEELVSGLSYCANRRTVGQVVGDQRSHGLVEEANSLATVHQDYIKYCGGLDDSAFLLRRDVLADLAGSGVVEAKEMYFEAGPLGRWPAANEYIPLSSDEISSWGRKSVQLLEQSIRDGDFRSYKTLASIYGSSADDPVLGSFSNPSTSYAYEVLWVSSMQGNPETPKELKDSLRNYMDSLATKFTAEQRREGAEKAEKIRLDMKK
ncbi:hypothetical protein [Paracidovorax wautersii]|uniref:hypothetical protein n=1 Tax=Paracidovorax wautersii TaxID=1177982 RepID=UPI0031E41452